MISRRGQKSHRDFAGRRQGAIMIRVRKTRRAFGLTAATVILALAGCRGDAAGAAMERANPASENCVASGGRLVIETAGDGGEYGVCLFEDNRQCEEWALLRGACPLGGIRITGYATTQARYCAIRGGDYVVTRQATATTPEQGTCTLPGEPTCDALALYEGRCPDRPAGTRA
jgi:putative hemolysin